VEARFLSCMAVACESSLRSEVRSVIVVETESDAFSFDEA
jgi:hypothetical protein